MMARPFSPLRGVPFRPKGLTAAGIGSGLIQGRGCTGPRRTGTIRSARLATRLLGIALAWIAPAACLDAAPYYTATYVGGTTDWFSQTAESITNRQTGVSYPFVTTTTPITAVGLQNLPTTTVMQGITSPQPEQYSMYVSAVNNSGTVVGLLPSGASHADPWGDVVPGYAVQLSDGRYSQFMPLTGNIAGGSDPATFYLSQDNQFLYIYHPQDGMNSPEPVSSLVDVKSGTITPLSRLVPPALLQQFKGGFSGLGIDDRGDIWVRAYSGNLDPDAYYILTPSDLTPTTPTPEPSSLLVFASIAGAMSLRMAAKRFRTQSHH